MQALLNQNAEKQNLGSRLGQWSLALFLAFVVNSMLYLLVPRLQVQINPSSNAKKVAQKVERELVLNPSIPERTQRKVIQEIKPVSLQQPQNLSPSRPAGGGGLKIDLSPAGGEGLALLSGGDRTGGIGSGTGGGVGAGNGPLTYEMGQTDSDARPVGPDPALRYPPRAEREGITGYAELAFVVNEMGYIEQVTVLKEEPAGYGFAASAIESARKLRFQPATLQKMSVRQNFRRRFNFEQ